MGSRSWSLLQICADLRVVEVHVRCALCVVRCALCVVRCALCVVRCALCVVRCALCVVRSCVWILSAGHCGSNGTLGFRWHFSAYQLHDFQLCMAEGLGVATSF